jgi:hypothetical protein
MLTLISISMKQTAVVLLLTIALFSISMKLGRMSRAANVSVVWGGRLNTFNADLPE